MASPVIYSPNWIKIRYTSNCVALLGFLGGIDEKKIERKKLEECTSKPNSQSGLINNYLLRLLQHVQPNDIPEDEPWTHQIYHKVNSKWVSSKYPMGIELVTLKKLYCHETTWAIPSGLSHTPIVQFTTEMSSLEKNCYDTIILISILNS